MSGHTKGPLAARRDRQGRYMQVYTSKQIVLATVYGSGGDPEDLENLPDVANAQLFAAAPEMLEALRELHDLAFRNGFGHEQPAAMDKAATAIAKAEGRS